MGQLKALIFTVGLTGLIMWLGIYLQTRNPNSEPTRLERIVAKPRHRPAHRGSRGNDTSRYQAHKKRYRWRW